VFWNIYRESMERKLVRGFFMPLLTRASLARATGKNEGDDEDE